MAVLHQKVVLLLYVAVGQLRRNAIIFPCDYCIWWPSDCDTPRVEMLPFSAILVGFMLSLRHLHKQIKAECFFTSSSVKVKNSNGYKMALFSLHCKI